MPAITITVPAAVAGRVMSALCAAGGYSTVSQANAVAALVAHIRQTVVNVEVAAATKAPPVIAPPEGLS